jgi:hypothetical protein
VVGWVIGREEGYIRSEKREFRSERGPSVKKSYFDSFLARSQVAGLEKQEIRLDLDRNGDFVPSTKYHVQRKSSSK